MFQHSSNTMNSDDAVGSQTGIDYACVHQRYLTSSLSLICNGVKPFPRTDHILDICNAAVLEIRRM
jgi:hypothetical protein